MTNLIIIDASGSMTSKIDEVKGGLKELFKNIKEDYKNAKKKVKPRTIVLDFAGAGDVRTIVDSKDLKELKDEVAESYSTRGMTALYDAIGKGFEMIDKAETQVFINVITDGAENDSKEFNSASIRKLVEEGKKKGYAITFMGTTEAALSQATSIGVSKGNMAMFSDSKKGVDFSMKKMSNVRNAYYESASLGREINLDNLMTDDKTKEEG